MDVSRSLAPNLMLNRAWTRALFAVALYGLWITGWYWSTVVSMVSIWYRSETFTHGFLIFPVAAWLVWRDRHELAKLAPSQALSVLQVAALVATALLWFAGDLADVIAARQFAWVALLVVGIWVIVGDRVARRLMFPLGFLFFAVPFGEFMMPKLIEWTADFTVAALRASGVPVLREGMTFQIPTGSWSVVEACSGLRYLIASLTVGVLYAYLAYRSMARRLAFVALSILTPLVANWIRAYLIVMIGHLSGNRLAVGVDHIIYGWIFFGLVMLIMFWVGSLWREPAGGADANAARTTPVNLAAPVRADARAMIAALFVLAALPPLAIRLLQGYGAPAAVVTAAPALGDWQPVARPLTTWTPQFTPPRAVIGSTYERGAQRAGLYVAIYYDQDADSKLVSSSNQLIRTTDHSGYVVSERAATVALDDHRLAVRESVLRMQGERFLARQWFFIDGEFTDSPVRAKLLQAAARLRGRGDSGAIVVVYAPLPADGEAVSPALDDLTRKTASLLPGVLSQRLRVARR
ncbi:MAG TPA: exosortase A [Casimicrobiaceae bacterium]|nr:exosortase A [Casimicrobiaceae bacterium]